MNLKEIDEYFRTLVFEDNPLFIDSFEFEESLVNFQLENHKGFDGKIYEPKKKISVFQTFDLAREFIESLPKNYKLLYEKMFEECNIVISEDNANSYFDTYENIVRIEQTKTISDVFSLVHEFMHYTNDRIDVITETSTYYTEVFSWFIELLLCDYIEINYPMYTKDVLCIKRNNFICTYQASIKSKIFFELIKYKTEGKTINQYIIKEIIKLLESFDIKEDNILLALDDVFGEIEDDYYEDTENAFVNNLRYSIAQPLAVYMYHQTKEKNIEEILDLNFQLQYYELDDVLQYLNLKEMDDLKLSYENLTKLNNEYVKEKKKVW